jgi:signal transduction histidine kinase
LQIKGIQPERELLQVKVEFQHLIEIYQQRAMEKQIDLKVIAQDETVYCDRESFRFIFRNLLDNAIKYTQNGTIILQAQRKEQQTLLTITDTGFGIAIENQSQLFSSEKPNLKVGTKGEKGSGLGLKLVAEHVKKNHGSITLNKSTQEGSEFLLTFTSEPKNQTI